MASEHVKATVENDLEAELKDTKDTNYQGSELSSIKNMDKRYMIEAREYTLQEK